MCESQIMSIVQDNDTKIR